MLPPILGIGFRDPGFHLERTIPAPQNAPGTLPVRIWYRSRQSGVTGGLKKMLQPDTVAGFRARLRGELISPEDVGYEAAREVYNRMIDRKPALIAKCSDVADVIAAVQFGRENG